MLRSQTMGRGNQTSLESTIRESPLPRGKERSWSPCLIRTCHNFPSGSLTPWRLRFRVQQQMYSRRVHKNKCRSPGSRFAEGGSVEQ